MRKKDVISVIIPVFNVEQYLERCVESIIRQTYDKLQIILINDGSNDKSGVLCDELKQRDNRICVFHKNWGGLADTRNIGLAFATGEYISFIDSDDYIHDTMMEEMCTAMKTQECDIAICGRCDLFEKNPKARNRKAFCLNEKNFYVGNEILKEYFLGRSIEQASCCDKMFHYSIIKELRFPVGKTSEDIYFVYNAFKKAKRIVHVGKPLYFYCHRNNSITTKVPVDKSEIEVIDFLKKIEKDLWKSRKKFLIGSFYSFYLSTFFVLYDEIKKSSEVDREFLKYIFRLKLDAITRILFIMKNSNILSDEKWNLFKILIGR